MKVGKRVWFVREGKDGARRYVEATIAEFGKGTTASVKLPDGRELEIAKVLLLAKSPIRLKSSHGGPS